MTPVIEVYSVSGGDVTNLCGLSWKLGSGDGLGFKIPWRPNTYTTQQPQFPEYITIKARLGSQLRREMLLEPRALTHLKMEI